MFIIAQHKRFVKYLCYTVRMEKHPIATIVTTVGLVSALAPFGSAEAKIAPQDSKTTEVREHNQPAPEETQGMNPATKIAFIAVAGAGAILMTGALAPRKYEDETPLQEGDQAEYLPGR